MSHDVQHAKPTQCRQPNTAHGVSNEIQEGGAERTEPPVGREAVADGGHRVFADTEANVTTGGGVLLEVTWGWVGGENVREGLGLGFSPG